MGLVDDQPANSEVGQPLHEPRAPKSLRGHEQQTVFACDGPAQPIDLLGPLQGRVDERRGDAPLGEAVDLILHKGDEGRDNQR